MNRDGASSRAMVKPELGLLVTAVVGIAVATGCTTGSHTPNAASTSGLAATSTATIQPATATADPAFVGHWHVHGATMDIGPATATIVASSGPCGAGAQGMC